jgi:O-antigen ligase
MMIAVAAELAIATAATLSRSSYVAAAGFVLAFLILRGWRFGAITVIALLVIAPLAAGGEINTLEQAVARLTATFSPSGLDASSGARIDLWQAALRATVDHPIFGLGWQQFAPNLAVLWEGTVSGLAVVSRSGEYAYAHNLYLTVLSQGGAVGAVLLLAVIVSCTRDAFEARGDRRTTAVLALVVVGAASVFGEPMLAPAVSVPFLIINASARMSGAGVDAPP